MSDYQSLHYLGKGGRIFGPFTVEQMETLHLTGEIGHYTYIWEEQSHSWKNLDPLPPSPKDNVSNNENDFSTPFWEGICHNLKDMVSGKIVNHTETGCDLLCADPTDAPKLAINSTITLNVMDRSKGKSVNVKAFLWDSTRKNGQWVYRIRWAKRPIL